MKGARAAEGTLPPRVSEPTFSVAVMVVWVMG